MKTNKGNTTILMLIIAGILIIPAIFDKQSTTTKEITTVNENKKTINKNTPQKIDQIQVPVVPKTETTAKTQEKADDPNKSPYADKIEISYLYGTSDKPKSESIVIINKSNETIDLTGFTIETYDKQYFKIPKGYNLPGFEVFPKDNILLESGGTLSIYVGTQERKMDFRENICTGYFDEKSDFGNALTHNCPRIDVSKMLDFSDKCIYELNNIPRCKMYQSKMNIEYKCQEFAMEHYSYTGCVKDYKESKNFFSKRWVMWMQKTYNFFRNEHERVELKDANNKIVDTYSY